MTPRVFIAYPALFNCYSKFARKLGMITRDLSDFEVVMCSDSNNFIHLHFENDSRVLAIAEISAVSDAGITHAVIFDDGETFPHLCNWAREQQLTLRHIQVTLTRVINIKTDPQYQRQINGPDYEYIGRGSYWGNPHAMYENAESREEVIRKFRYDLEYDKFINIDITRVHELSGKRLGCFCKPAPCHGDVLADFLNSYDDGT